MGKVLLVDDDDATVYITQRLLRQSGMELDLLVARHGREALDMIRQACLGQECPKWILLDISMPVMDGFRFLEELQKADDLDSAAFKIALLTSSTHRADLARAREYPVIDVIEKPLTLQKLLKFL